MKPKFGDVVYVHRTLGYDHYGVYVGRGKVIHYGVGEGGTSAGGGSNGVVTQTTLRKFLESDAPDDLEVSSYPKLDGRAARQRCVDRARSSLGAKDYNLVFNNCEHFARWCRTGESLSTQVEKAATHVVSAVLAVGIEMLLEKHGVAIG